MLCDRMDENMEFMFRVCYSIGIDLFKQYK